METYETIDGRWWSFVDNKPIRPLTDEEAAQVIWGRNITKQSTRIATPATQQPPQASNDTGKRSQ